MRSLPLLLLAILLTVTAFVAYSAAGRQLRLADAERDLVSLQFERAAGKLAELADTPWPSAVRPFAEAADTARRADVAQYWGPIAASSPPDADLSLLAANAAYRASERAGGPWNVVVGQLDAVLKRYGDTVRQHPEDEDAAWNYEFLVRRRGQIVAAKKPLLGVPPNVSGRTLHGDVGAPPEEQEMQQFRMIVPMQPNERREAEEAGRGAPRVRKG